MEKELDKVVNTKVVHLDEVLDEGQRVVRVWFENLLIQGLKVGKMVRKSQVTIITCEWNLNFPLI
jgi:hypothetical protein